MGNPIEMMFSAEELCKYMRQAGAEVVGESGMVMNPFTGQWSMSRDTAVNYIISFKKSSSTREQYGNEWHRASNDLPPGSF